MNWAIGVTSCHARQTTLLPAMLAQLHQAGWGFEHGIVPRVFADSCQDPTALAADLAGRSPWFVGLEVTARWPTVGAWGNWRLSLIEVHARNPVADLYGIFQDDLLASLNLRRYCERTCHRHEKRYWNLYSEPSNEEEGGIGWREGRLARPSDSRRRQAGRGALGLVFTREGVHRLLCDSNLALKAADPRPDYRTGNIDGAVAGAMNDAGFREMVHVPSLLQHAEGESTLGHEGHYERSKTWRGSDWDAMSLLR